MLTPKMIRKMGREIIVERRGPTADRFSTVNSQVMGTGIWIEPGSGRLLLLSNNTLLPFGATVVMFRGRTGRILWEKDNLEYLKMRGAHTLMTMFAVVVVVVVDVGH